MAPRNVTVIGAGIVGIACALYLQRDGHRTIVVDRLPPGEGCSAGNAGVLSSGSCLPMNMPGTLRNVPRWLLDPLGPLAVSWAYLPRLLPWLVRFARGATAERVARVADALRALHRTTVDSYLDLARDAGCQELIRPSGYLHVYESEARFGKDVLLWEMRRARGVTVEFLGAQEIRELDSSLAPIFKRAAFMPDHGYARNPLRLVQALAAHFARAGGTLHRGEVRDFELGPRGASRIHTDDGTLDVDVLLIAAGAWSGALCRRLGNRVPLESERGYHVTIDKPGIEPRHPITFADHHFVATPMEMGLRLAGTDELAGLAAPPNYARARVLLDLGRRMFKGLDPTRYTMWMGHRPGTPDTLPVIGRSPRFADVYFAFGHGHTGLTAAPMTGQLIADLVAGRNPRIDVMPFRVDRF